MGKMLLTMAAVSAEMERHLIAERTTAALDHRERVAGDCDKTRGREACNAAQLRRANTSLAWVLELTRSNTCSITPASSIT